MFALFRSNDYVDATKDEGLARFINCGCEPNAVSDEIGGSICIFAAIDVIAKGSEITYDYLMEDGDPKVCMCGSPRCRGVF